MPSSWSAARLHQIVSHCRQLWDCERNRVLNFELKEMKWTHNVFMLYPAKWAAQRFPTSIWIKRNNENEYTTLCTHLLWRSELASGWCHCEWQYIKTFYACILRGNLLTRIDATRQQGWNEMMECVAAMCKRGTGGQCMFESFSVACNVLFDEWTSCWIYMPIIELFSIRPPPETHKYRSQSEFSETERRLIASENVQGSRPSFTGEFC